MFVALFPICVHSNQDLVCLLCLSLARWFSLGVCHDLLHLRLYFFLTSNSLPFLTREQIRDQFDIRGSCLMDFCVVNCCLPCSLVQHDKEVAYRQALQPLQTDTGYVAPPAMRAICSAPGSWWWNSIGWEKGKFDGTLHTSPLLPFLALCFLLPFGCISKGLGSHVLARISHVHLPELWKSCASHWSLPHPVADARKPVYSFLVLYSFLIFIRSSPLIHLFFWTLLGPQSMSLRVNGDSTRWRSLVPHSSRVIH